MVIMVKVATREAYGKELARLVSQNKKVIGIDADLSNSTKTGEMIKIAPSRHFNVGIAEQNLIGIAAGFAANNYIPFVSTFAVFATGRAYDQIRNTVCYSNLNVKICGTHSGISVGEDGATHQALEDIAIMRAIPNFTVIQPCDSRETKEAVKAIANYFGPVYLRLGRFPVAEVNVNNKPFEIGKGVVIHEGESNITMFATGNMVQESLKALKVLNKAGIDPSIINIHTIKPIDKKIIIKYAQRSRIIITLEEHSIIGGLGSAVSEVLSSTIPTKQIFIGTNDMFGESGKADLLMNKYELSAESIAKTIICELK